MSLPITFGSFCSGIEAPSEAWAPLGWECVYTAEVEPFPAAYLAHRHGAGRPRRMPRPEDAATPKAASQRRAAIKALDRVPSYGIRWGERIPNFGDVAQIEAAEVPAVDIVAAGFPCFPAGTMIALRRGFVPIQDVVVGDEALTHAGRFRAVTRTGSKTAETCQVTGQGHPGLVTTANHPFLSRQKWGQSTRRNGKAVRLTGIHPETWTPASEMAGKHWACVAQWPFVPVPTVELVGAESRAFVPCDELFRLAGAYLGDGWAKITGRNGRVVLGLNADKFEKLKPTLDALGAYSANPERTVIKVTIPSRALARWLIENFGSGAAQKRIPMWALGMPQPWRAALLEGYLLTDGSASERGAVANSVSPDLALTARMLANSLGYASSVTLNKTADTCVIEGRTVNQRDYWSVTVSPSSRTSFEADGRRWQLVRSALPTGRRETVYDLTVDEDHSYVADGIIVHNCQGFSIAGLRGSLADARGELSIIGVRLILELAATGHVRGAVLENVPDILNTEDNAWGAILGGLVGADDPLEGLEHGGKWPRAGMVAGPRSRVCWRILDAQHFGLAQRRERVWALVDFGDHFDPAQVLLEPKGVPWDFEARCEKSQDVAPTLAGGARSRGGYSEDDVPHVVAGTLGADLDRHAAGQQARAGLLIPFGGNNTAGPIDTATCRSSHGGPHGRQDFESETFIVSGVAPPLTSNQYGDHESREGLLVAHSLRAEGFDASEDGTGRGTPLVPVAFPINSAATRAGEATTPSADAAGRVRLRDPGIGIGGANDPMSTLQTGTPHAVAFSCKDYGADAGELSPTLRAMGHNGSHANAGGQVAIAFNARQDPISGPVTGPLDVDQGTHAIAFSLRGREGGAMPEVEGEDVAPALRSADGGSTRPFVAWSIMPQNSNADFKAREVDVLQPVTGSQGVSARGGDVVQNDMAVRRITVTEAERLQGFPDDATLIPWPSALRTPQDGAETVAYLRSHGLSEEEALALARTPDGPRYKAIGNSWPVAVAAWIGRRLDAALLDDGASRHTQSQPSPGRPENNPSESA